MLPVLRFFKLHDLISLALRKIIFGDLLDVYVQSFPKTKRLFIT